MISLLEKCFTIALLMSIGLNEKDVSLEWYLVVMSFCDVDEGEGVVLVVGCFLKCGVVLK